MQDSLALSAGKSNQCLDHVIGFKAHDPLRRKYVKIT